MFCVDMKKPILAASVAAVAIIIAISVVLVQNNDDVKINDFETVKVLNIFDVGSILRVKRFGAGIGHTYGSKLDVLNREISIPVKIEKFDSKVNDLVYFNANESVGLGTTVPKLNNLSKSHWTVALEQLYQNSCSVGLAR